MLVDALTKHLADLTVLNEFFSSNRYSLREDPELEIKREQMRTDRKKKKASTSCLMAYFIVNYFTDI